MRAVKTVTENSITKNSFRSEKMVRERILRSLIHFITGMKRGTEMKQYYAERNGLIQGQLSIDLDELLELFKQTYD